MVVGMVAIVWVIWSGLSVWLSWRSIERVELDVDAARDAIAALDESERPPPPPVEIIPEPPTIPPASEPPVTTTPSVPIATTTTTTTTTATTEAPEPPEIIGEQLPYDPAYATSPAIPDDAFNAFLIIGSDARANRSGSRADVIILALLPEDDSPPILVSLPRDLWLSNSCWGRARRINIALNGCGDAASGPELLAITVADFTGIQPDHFALFDFDDFQRVIDAFGGIRVCVDNPVRDGPLNLPAGCTNADGQMTLAWVRSRRTQELVDGEWRAMRGVNDLTRNERQRDLLVQLLGKLKSFDALTSPVEIVDSVSDAVIIDDGITVGSAVGLAWDLRDVAPGRIAKLSIPVRHHRTEGGPRCSSPTPRSRRSLPSTGRDLKRQSPAGTAPVSRCSRARAAPPGPTPRRQSTPSPRVRSRRSKRRACGARSRAWQPMLVSPRGARPRGHTPPSP